MYPSFPPYYVTDRNWMNTQLPRKMPLRNSSSNRKTYHAYDVFGESHVPAAGSACNTLRMLTRTTSVAGCQSSLFSCVGSIFPCSTNPKMCRVTARWYITGMTNKLACRNLPVGEYVGNTMSWLITALERKLSVAFRCFSRKPQPTFVDPAAVDFRPKALTVRFRNGRLEKLHGVSRKTLWGRTARDVPHREPFGILANHAAGGKS